MKFKGPLFLVEDKKKEKKFVLLNQYVSKDLIIPVNESYHYELKDLGNGQSMLNMALNDTISGWNIRGFWSQDQNLKNIFKCITTK